MSSKKIRLITIGTVVLLVLALAGYFAADFFIGQKEKAEADEAASLQLFTFDANSINKVVFDTDEGFFQMEMVNSKWAITEKEYPHDFILNSGYISVVCSYMSHLTADKKFDTEGKDLDAYGLATPSVLTCYAGDTTYTLEVGQPSATQEYFYVKKPDDETVFGISFEKGSVLSGDTSMLKSPFLINALDIEIASIRLTTGKDVNFDLTRTDSVWEMKTPLPNCSLDYTQINSMLTALVRYELDSFITIADETVDLAQFGLDKPSHTLKVVTLDGTTTTIQFAPKKEADNFVYLIYEESGQIATLSASTANFLNTRATELIPEEVLFFRYDEVKAVDAVVDDITFHLEMDYLNGQYTFDELDIDALGEDACTQARYLIDSMTNLKFEEMDVEAVIPDEAEPTILFRYTLTDDSVSELSLIPIDESTYWAMIDGEYTGLIVRRRAVSGNTGVLTFYEKMMDFLARTNES